jgi:hypothetical protein
VTVTSLHIARSAQSFLTGVTIPMSGMAAQREAKFSGNLNHHPIRQRLGKTYQKCASPEWNGVEWGQTLISAFQLTYFTASDIKDFNGTAMENSVP